MKNFLLRVNKMSYFALLLFTKKAEDIDIRYIRRMRTTMPNAMKFFAKSICAPF